MRKFAERKFAEQKLRRDEMILESIRDWFEQSTSLTDVELKSSMRCHETSFIDSP